MRVIRLTQNQIETAESAFGSVSGLQRKLPFGIDADDVHQLAWQYLLGRAKSSGVRWEDAGHIRSAARNAMSDALRQSFQHHNRYKTASIDPDIAHFQQPRDCR
jgi:hypothetical protein